MYSALKNKVHPMKPEIKDELLDELLKNYTSPEDLMGPEGLLAELKQRLISRVLDSELTTHLGYEKHEQKAARKENARNGHTPKTLRSDDGELTISVMNRRIFKLGIVLASCNSSAYSLVIAFQTRRPFGILRSCWTRTVVMAHASCSSVLLHNSVVKE